MLGCVTEMQRDRSPKTGNGLRQGSVLDILRPQAKPVTAQDSGMLYYQLLTGATVNFDVTNNISFHPTCSTCLFSQYNHV